MTNEKRKRRGKALLTSALSLALCSSMFVGTTFAWFTDSVESANNVIRAGNLDVELEYWKDGKWVDVEGKSDILTNTLWEPGVTEVAYLRLANAGSLSLKYKFGVNIVEETDGVNAAGETFKLSDYIMFGMVEGINVDENSVPYTYQTREEAIVTAGEAQKISVGYTDAATMVSGDELYFAMVVYMPTTVGNVANHDGETVPEIKLGIKVDAWQVTDEYDSFGPDYDAAADGTYDLTYKFNNEQDVLAFAPTAGDAASSGLRVEDGKAVVEKGGAWYEVDANVVLNNHAISYDLDITELDDGEHVIVDTGDSTTWNSTPIYIERGSAKVYYGTAKNEYIGTLEGTELAVSHTYNWNEDGAFTITTAISDGEETLTYAKTFAATGNEKIYWDIYSVSESDAVTMEHFTETYTEKEITSATQLKYVFAAAKDGAVINMPQSFNTSEKPVAEAFEIENDITLNPNGMYLVSAAPATFSVAEGASLTVTEGSFTIKNTAKEGAAVVVDGGEFTMAGGSFDAHTAVRTAEGKSSTVNLTAGWSNRVTVGFDLKGSDTVNVTGGSLYTSAESIKTVANTHVNINMSGGLLSSGSTQYSAAVILNGTANVNVTGGTIANTYASGLNGSAAIEARVAPTTINVSGDASLTGKGWGVTLGDHWSSPAVTTERFTLNISGNAQISATGDTGFGIRYCQDGCDVTVSGNAKVSGKFHAIQMNSNSYVFTNSTLTIADYATVTSTAGRYGGGYAIAAYGNVTITGGTISGTTVGLAVYGAGVVAIVDNSVSGTPITINKADIGAEVNYTVAGNPTIG